MIDAELAYALATRYPGRIESRPVMQDVTTDYEPDPHWSYTDPAGHAHRWVSKDGSPLWLGGSVPTVERVVTGSHWCAECQDDHEESELRCRECGAVVKPGQMRTWGRHEIVVGYDVEPIQFGTSEGEFTDDGAVATFKTPVGDTFRVIEYKSGLAPWDEWVRVIPRPIELAVVEVEAG